MAEVLQLSRNTKVFIKDTEAAGGGSDQMWEIPVLDGYSFSQATENAEVSLNEASDANNSSRRGVAAFNTALAPVEWSFASYARPFLSDGGFTSNSGLADFGVNMHAVEEALWAYFVSGLNVAFTPPTTTTNAAWSNTPITSNGTAMTINFNQSNKTALRVFELYFVLGYNQPGGELTTYNLVDACVNSVTLDFDIEGIAQFTWSGYAKEITASNTTPVVANTISEATSSTNTFIRNRLNILTVNTSSAQQNVGMAANYSVVLTGGSITLENNITYLTPEEIGKVNFPLGHVTGARKVSGNFTAYLNDDHAANSTGALYNDMAAATSITTHDFNITIKIGGTGSPRVEFALPQVNMEIPQHQIQDVIGVTFNFNALPSTLSTTDEATITYVGPSPNA